MTQTTVHNGRFVIVQSYRLHTRVKTCGYSGYTGYKKYKQEKQSLDIN